MDYLTRSSLGILILLVAACLVKGDEPKCIAAAMINEINPGNPDVTGKPIEEGLEFIEFKPTCPGPFSFAGYSVVVWKSGKGKDETAKAVLKLNLSSYSLPVGIPYLVLAGPDLVASLRTTTTAAVHSFKEQNITEWKRDKMTSGFMDNGSGRVLAWVLYKGLDLNKLAQNSILSENTANVEKIVDVVFYHRDGHISQSMLRYLTSDYSLNGISLQESLVLKDNDKKGADADKSLSYCCETLQTKWPLAYQHVKVSPGTKNECASVGEAKNFIIHKEAAGKLNMAQRCDKNFVKTFVPEIKPKKNTKEGKAIQGQSTEKVQKIVSKLQQGVQGEVASLVDTGKHLLEDSIQETTRQVTTLAAIVGTIVVVLGLTILGGSYLYIRRRKNAPRTRGCRQQARDRSQYNSSLVESDTEYDSTFDRQETLAHVRVP